MKLDLWVKGEEKLNIAPTKKSHGCSDFVIIALTIHEKKRQHKKEIACWLFIVKLKLCFKWYALFHLYINDMGSWCVAWVDLEFSLECWDKKCTAPSTA